MSVRVIAGVARGRRLAVPDVGGLRPTSDRARETLFNVLAPRLPGARFLDLFAGSGAVGIEALSRGAAAAVFIEQNALAVATLEANLELCRFAGSATVVRGAWQGALRRLAGAEEPLDVAFLDPPYDWADAHSCLEAILDHALIAAHGIAVVEHRDKQAPRTATGWELLRRVDVGDTAFSFFVVAGGPETADSTG
ncbi:MAG: 16S rRNA (guanine(966)-N(2))-methyltransferase RsmD [Acidobacteria bacterium]|nr:16S rRNA (guanine(966)-N(2))-methyltransferase RsmD [Acidobacteriota bacterium]